MANLPLAKVLVAVPSNREVAALRTMRTISSSATSYTKMKSLSIPYGGDYNIRFRISTESPYGSNIWYVTVYKNGAAIGREESHNSTVSLSATSFSQTIGTWSAGDTCELWAKSGGVGTGGLSDFVISAELDWRFPPLPKSATFADTTI